MSYIPESSDSDTEEVKEVLFKDFIVNFNEDRFIEFTEKLNLFTQFTQTHVKLPKLRKLNPKNRRKKNVLNHKEIQRQYRRNRRQTIRAILAEDSDTCEIDADEVACCDRPHQMTPNL